MSERHISILCDHDHVFIEAENSPTEAKKKKNEEEEKTTIFSRHFITWCGVILRRSNLHPFRVEQKIHVGVKGRLSHETRTSSAPPQEPVSQSS